MPVVKLSVPTVIQQCTPSLSSVVLTACVSNFGIVAMAGYGIVNKLDMILFIFAKPVAGMFGCSTEVADLVQHCVSFLIWGYLFNAVTQCFMGRINGYGQPEKGMIITVINHIVIRIPFSIILSGTALGLDGIWITLLFSFVVAFVCAYVIDKHITRQKIKNN